MAVYVDDMFKHPMGRFKRMKMSHMIADTDDELHTMAARIGMKRQWFQGNHYDVSLAMRELAVEHGAIEVDCKTLALMAANKRNGLPMGTPETARSIWQQWRSQRVQLIAS